MSEQKTVVDVLKEATNRRAEIETIICETNNLSCLSSCFHSFGDSLWSAQNSTSLDDAELKMLLDAVQKDENFVYEGTNRYLDDLVNNARELINEARSCGVVVDFDELMNTNINDIDYISSWSSSSLGC